MEVPASLHRSLAIARLRNLWAGGARKERPVEETVGRIVAVLNRLGIRWCLIGAHAIGEYTQPRATEDVDLLIDDRRIVKLLAELRAELGDIDVDDLGPEVRLRREAVDLVRASSNTVFRRALAESVDVGAWRFPRPEALLVMNFLSATSPFRGLDRRRQDLLDLIALYRALDPEALDRGHIAELAATIYPGAEDELSRLLAKVDADEPIEI